MEQHLAIHIKVGNSARIFLQNQSQKLPGLRYVPFHVLELRIIFYVEINGRCLSAYQICD